jgi:hypothetical protein
VQGAPLTARRRQRDLGGGQRDPVLVRTVEGDFEVILPRLREGQVEDQYRARLDIGHSGGWLAELHRALALYQRRPPVILKANPHRMRADLGTPPAHPEHQVGARMHGGELRDPDVLEEAEDRELAVLVDQRVIREDREIEQQGQATRMDVMRSFLRIALTTSMPLVTCPKTVCTLSRCACGEWQMKN